MRHADVIVRFATLLVVVASPIRADTALKSPHFRVDQIAPDVYAVIQSDPLGLANHANSVFIVGHDDVIVVDAQFTLERTREVLAAIRKVTDKPVRVLVDTHWHDDHTFGNQVYGEAFPTVEIISQTNTKLDMETTGVENRKGQVAGGPDAIAMFRDCIAKKTAMDGTPMSDDEGLAYESTIAIAQEYLNDMPRFQLMLPTATFEQRLALKHGDRVVELRHFGPAATRGDAVVWLPKERVLVTGDLFDDPVPFAYGCDVGGWMASLDSLQALEPSVIVPGHGDVVKDAAALQRLRDTLASIQRQALASVHRDESLEQATAAIDITPLNPPHGKMLQFLFKNYLVGPVVGSTFKEVSAAK